MVYLTSRAKIANSKCCNYLLVDAWDEEQCKVTVVCVKCLKEHIEE